MNIYIVPIRPSGFREKSVVIRLRSKEEPVLFMCDATVTTDGSQGSLNGNSSGNTCIISILGSIQDQVSLQDNDVLLISEKNNPLSCSAKVSLEQKNDIWISEDVQPNPIGMAARMEKSICVFIGDTKYKHTVSTAVQIIRKAEELYKEYPAFQNIMAKDSCGNTTEMSFLTLITRQDPEFVRWAETMILSIDSRYKTTFPIAKQILEQARTDNGFTLLSKEEQVAAFLEFSKRHADKAEEIVTDELLAYLKESPEYAYSLEKLKQAGLGQSKTQQFNVLQQVGYFGGLLTSNHKNKNNVIYNLSDMGAGKTLMTVQAVFVMDCIRIGVWNRTAKKEDVKVDRVYLPDKHIIAPALSVKSSWVDTFRLFYDVEKVNDCEYILKMEFGNTAALCSLYIAPFTVRKGKVFVQKTLPEPSAVDTCLIVDEIHQLVKRRISRTKFFVPKCVPIQTYQIFALSGTMSNLKSGEWLSLIRFLGDTDILNSTIDAKSRLQEQENFYHMEISAAAKNIEMVQHKKFSIGDIGREQRYQPQIRKKSVVEQDYYMTYGSKIFIPDKETDHLNMESLFDQRRYSIEVEPEESDNVSFELFYRIAATSAITAQSLQVAEELFGEQATQHKSSIIKTMSPFTDEEILLLDTLHKIAADANKYRSANIGRDINNAILNLNDGLQQKDLYTLIAGFAERNTRFLEYLAGLDVNVLERLPKTGLIHSPDLTETHKFHVLKELLEKDKDETFLIVVNDYRAMKMLSDALGISCLTKQELKDEMAYQELLDGLFEKQNIVIVTQDMIKSSLDLIQANRLVQYQLNTEVSDIIQTQNRINRIGQTRETRCYYIAADRLQNALIELFLDSYRNIRVAHKGIVELFADLSSQIDVINDYLDVAFRKLGESTAEEEGMIQDVKPDTKLDDNTNSDTDLAGVVTIPGNYHIRSSNGICNAILYPEKNGTSVIVPLRNGNPFRMGLLKPGIIEPVTSPTRAMWNIKEMKLIR